MSSDLSPQSKYKIFHAFISMYSSVATIKHIVAQFNDI